MLALLLALALAIPAIGAPRHHPGPVIHQPATISTTLNSWSDNVTTGAVRLGYYVENDSDNTVYATCQIYLWMADIGPGGSTYWTVDYEAQRVKVIALENRFVWDSFTWQGYIYDVTISCAL